MLDTLDKPTDTKKNTFVRLLGDGTRRKKLAHFLNHSAMARQVPLDASKKKSHELQARIF